MSLSVKWLVTGPFQQNSYLLVCDQTKEAIFVDPGDEADRLAKLAQDEGVTPVAIWCTHCHIDHVGAVAELQDLYKIPVYVPDGDREWLDALPMQASMFRLPPKRVPRVDGPVTDGATVSFGQVRGQVIATPGHTEGGSCFWFPEANVLITGDTLFDGSVGRTDLPGGDHPTLVRSIKERLFTLPDEVTFYSGHGDPGSLGREKKHNPFVGEQAAGGFTKRML